MLGLIWKQVLTADVLLTLVTDMFMSDTSLLLLFFKDHVDKPVISDWMFHTLERSC